MELSLIHAGLAAGAALAAIPVILHLFMRQTPKHVVFPALRLIRERQKKSRKRMKIKNWLLLAARMALLALMALALARPRLHSDMPLGDESVPTVLGLVFDTSLSMGYKENDKTLLDQAKDRAREILGRIPESSLVFPVKSSDPTAVAQNGMSPSAARKWIDNLAVTPVNRPLNVATGQVYPAVADCDRPRREVYILTDLSRSSWAPDRPAEGLERARQAKDKAAPAPKIATFVLRVGSEERKDVSIDEVALSSTTTTQGEPLEVRGVIRSQGTEPVSPVVEFYLDGVKKGNRQVEIPPGGQAEPNFPMPPGLKEGKVHRVELRLTGAPDPLKFNDARFLSFEVRPALKVLLIADQAVDADYVALALDPPGSLKSFELEHVRPAELVARHRETLKDFAAVFLLNVATLDDSAWGLLNGYVHEGGGLVAGLGDRCDAKNYNGPTASQVMPAELVESLAAPKGEMTFGKILDVTHPLFERFTKEFDSQFSVIPVFRYWKIKPHDTSRALVSFADGAPALVERTFRGAKTGRVLLWSTPLARRPGLNDRARWNELPHTTYWAFPVLMNLTVPYLAGATSDQLNFEAGEDVLLNLKPDARYQNFVITAPDEKTREQKTPPAAGEPLKILAPQLLGQWAVTAVGPNNEQTPLGFSLNPPRSESALARLEPADLDAMFGKDGYALAENGKVLEDLINVVRVGHEIFPWLMMLILLLVTAENFLANTFYKEPPAPVDAGKGKGKAAA